MVLRIHGKDESVVRFRQGAPAVNYSNDTKSLLFFCFVYNNVCMKYLSRVPFIRIWANLIVFRGKETAKEYLIDFLLYSVFAIGIMAGLTICFGLIHDPYFVLILFGMYYAFVIPLLSMTARRLYTVGTKWNFCFIILALFGGLAWALVACLACKSEEEAAGKSHKKRIKVPMTIAIISAPASLILAFFCIMTGLTVYAIADTPRFNESRKIAREQLVPLCKGNNYVFDNIEGSSLKIQYGEYYFDDDLEKIDTNGAGKISSLALYTEDYYYFLAYSGKYWNSEDYVVRTNHNFTSPTIIGYLGKNTEKVLKGYDTNIYYKSEGKYFIFDLINENKTEVSESSQEAIMINGGYSAYKNFLGIEYGECKKEESMLNFKYFNKDLTLDENFIDTEIYKIMKKCSFEPYYHLSFSSGITSIVYFGYPDPWGGWADCLIIDFDRSTNSVLDYQLFDNVDRYNFRLYPKLVLN